jgi:hypothetical protein
MCVSAWIEREPRNIQHATEYSNQFLRAVSLNSPLTYAFGAGEPLQIDATIGNPTNGMCPISWIHQRMLIAGGRWTSRGMTASDLTIQMKAP